MSPFLPLIYVFIFLFSLFGVGHLLSKKIGALEISSSIVIGSLLFSFIISILGFWLPINIICGCFILLGTLNGFFSFRFISFQLNKIPWMVISYLSFGFIISMIPSSYFDPLNYHLYGIVEWAKLNYLRHIPQAIQLMHVSYADYLFFPFAFLFDLKSIDGLVSFQISSQILSFFLGITIFSFLFLSCSKPWISKHWIGLIIVMMLLRASLQHKAFIAKNDWICLSWFLFGIKIFLEKEKNNLSLFFVCFALSLSVGTKLTYFFPLILFFTGIQIYVKKMSSKEVAYCVAIFVFSVFPYLMRNYVWTQNPIFPMAYKIFPSQYLSQSWIQGFKFFDVQFAFPSFEIFQKKIWAIFTYEPVVYFYLVIPFFWRSISLILKFSWISILVFLFFFIFFFGSHTEFRHFGPIALGVNFLGVYGVKLVCDKFNFPLKIQNMIQISLFLVGIFNFISISNELNPIPKALLKRQFFPITQTLLEDKRGLISSKKIKELNLTDKSFAILDDTPPYYFSPFQVIRIWDDPLLDRKLWLCKDFSCVLSELILAKIDYLIFTDFRFDPYYHPGIYEAFVKAINKFPEAKVADTNGEKLISLKKLKRNFESD